MTPSGDHGGEADVADRSRRRRAAGGEPGLAGRPAGPVGRQADALPDSAEARDDRGAGSQRAGHQRGAARRRRRPDAAVGGRRTGSTARSATEGPGLAGHEPGRPARVPTSHAVTGRGLWLVHRLGHRVRIRAPATAPRSHWRCLWHSVPLRQHRPVVLEARASTAVPSPAGTALRPTAAGRASARSAPAASARARSPRRHRR